MSALPHGIVLSPLSVARRVLPTSAVVLGLALGVLMLLPAAFGLQRFVVTGGSMAGTFDRGSLLYEERVPVSDLRAGDVITYQPPRGKKGLVTHRIVAIGHDRAGRPVFRTKGDANAVADPWRFTLPRPQQSRVRLAIPLAGYPFAALGDRRVRMLVIGVPALIIALLSLASAVRPETSRS